MCKEADRLMTTNFTNCKLVNIHKYVNNRINKFLEKLLPVEQVYQSLTMPSVYFRCILCADPCVKHKCNLVTSPSNVTIIQQFLSSCSTNSWAPTQTTTNQLQVRLLWVNELLNLFQVKSGSSLQYPHLCEKMNYIAFK